MSLLEWPGLLHVHRDGKEIVARFARPMRVICTEPAAGGIRDDVTACYGHQLCEAAGAEHEAIRQPHLDQLHLDRCARLGVDPMTTIGLATAANVRCAGVATASFAGLEVAAVCTAGVEGNALCAGDPSGFHEVDGRIELLDTSLPPTGTIISMVFVNQELTAAALTRAAVTATEAKAAALRELLVGSRYSSRQATGTGSDQLLIACPRGDEFPLTEAGGHAKLGELIGRCVHDAIVEALDLQNSLTATKCRSLTTQLARFGVSKAGLIAAADELLSPPRADFFATNFLSVDRDPFVVAAAAGLATIADQLECGILPASAAEELAQWTGAQLAHAAALGEGDLAQFLAELTGAHFDVPTLTARAICLGFSHKWDRLDGVLDSSLG